MLVCPHDHSVLVPKLSLKEVNTIGCYTPTNELNTLEYLTYSFLTLFIKFGRPALD